LSGLAPGSLLESRYEILAELGKGGMGVVYKARDRELDETVALKVLRPDLVSSLEMAHRFRSEVKLARRARHRNVCGIHEYGQDGPLRFIVMEFVEGVDVRRLLKQHGALPPEQAVDVARQVAEGLQAIHDMGIVHRDLKTANVMLDAQGVARLMDFGIAKRFDADATGGATVAGQIVGTPEYMSPEQIRGSKIDARSDVYALGILLFEMLTGHVPFRGETVMATLLLHLSEPPPLEGANAALIPSGLVPVLRKALGKTPVERYASAREMSAALADAWLPGDSRRRVPLAPAPTRTAVAPVLEMAPDTAATPTPLSTQVPVPVSTAAHMAPTAAGVSTESLFTPATAPRLDFSWPGTARDDITFPAARQRGSGGVIGAVAGVVAVLLLGAWLAWRQDWTALRARLAAPEAAPQASPSATLLTEAAASPPVVTPSAAPEPVVTATQSAVRSDSPARVTVPLQTVAPMASPPAVTSTTQMATGQEFPVQPSVEDARLERAEDLFDKGRFGSALAEAKAVLAREPNNTRAKELIEDAEVELVVESRLKEARAAIERGDSDAALESVRAGLAAKSTDSRLIALWKQLTKE
jgi:serine/threonine-protein kinase